MNLFGGDIMAFGISESFNKRFNNVLDLIYSYNIDYTSIGIFGSYARGNYKASSDIDFCIVTDKRPDRKISGSLREEAEILGADIVWCTTDSFNNSKSKFMNNLRKDYKKIA